MASLKADVSSAINDVLHLDEEDQSSLLGVTISAAHQVMTLLTLTLRVTVTMKSIMLQVISMVLTNQ